MEWVRPDGGGLGYLVKGIKEHLSELVALRPNLSNNDELPYDHPGHIPILQMRSLSLGRGLNMARIRSK